MRELRSLAVFALLALLLPTTARAQGWVLDLSAGHAAPDPALAAVSSTGLTLGVNHGGARWFFLSAGVPLDSVGLPWAATGLGGRLSTSGRGVALGLDLGAQGYGYQHRSSPLSGGGVTAEAMPLLGLGRGSVRLEARSGVLHSTRVLSGERAGRTLHQSDLRGTLGARSLLLTGEGRYLRAPEASYPYVGGGAEARLDRVSLSAHAGSWISEWITTPAWGIGARLRLGRGIEAHLDLRQETSDPLYWNAPQRSWSLGLSRKLGGTPRTATPLPLPGAGGITFRLPLAVSTSPPSLAGDFTEWKEVPMARAGDFWSVTLPVAAGVYRYAFRDAAGEWFVPESFHTREPDGYGGFNAVLIVR